jgi:hypothetical protein
LYGQKTGSKSVEFNIQISLKLTCEDKCKKFSGGKPRTSIQRERRERREGRKERGREGSIPK